MSIRCDVEIGSREAVYEAVAQGLGLGGVSAAAYRPDDRAVSLPFLCDDLCTHAHAHVHVVCLMERRQSLLVSRFMQVADQLR